MLEEIQAKEKAINGLNEQNAKNKQELKLTNGAMQELIKMTGAENIEILKTRVNNFEGDLADAKKDSEDLRQRNANLESEKTELENKLAVATDSKDPDELRPVIATLEKEKTELENILADLMTMTVAENIEILKTKVKDSEDLRRMNANLTDEVAAKDLRIENLTDEVIAKELRIVNLTGEMAETAEPIVNLTSEGALATAESIQNIPGVERTRYPSQAARYRAQQRVASGQTERSTAHPTVVASDSNVMARMKLTREIKEN